MRKEYHQGKTEILSKLQEIAKQNGVDLHQQATDSQQGNSFTEMEKGRKDPKRDMTHGL